MANQEQVDRLRQGVEAWNHWRKENPTLRIDLKEANLYEAKLVDVNLSGADLKGAVLYRADLSGANLSRAKLSPTDLSGACLNRADLSNAQLCLSDLSDADLTNACLNRADLRRANFRGANLNGADLSNAILDRAYFSNAKLQNAILDGVDFRNVVINEETQLDSKARLVWQISCTGAAGTNLDNVDLSEAVLTGANFKGVNLRNANLTRTILRGANFSNSNLEGANFTNAELQSANLNHANLDHVNLKGANLSSASLNGTSFRGANLGGTNLRHTNLRGIEIDEKTQLDAKARLVWRIVNTGVSGVDLSSSDLSGASLRDVDLSSTNLTRANLQGADLYSTNLSNADLRGADLNSANLTNAILRGAQLHGAVLRHVLFKNAVLQDAALSGADLSGANLSGLNLSGANLSDTNLRRANLLNTNLSHANLSNAELSNADLSGAYLQEANLYQANLSGANLYSTYLSDVDFSHTRIGGTLFISTQGLTSNQQHTLKEQGGLFDEDLSNSMMLGEVASPGVMVSLGFNERVELPNDQVIQHVTVQPPSSVERPSQPVSEPPPFPKPAYCHMRAEMDEQIIVRRVTTVEVTLSKEDLEGIHNATSQYGTTEIDESKRLIVQIVPKINFTIVDVERIEIETPQAEKSITLHFDLRATDLGEGEVWVVLRQEQLSLLTLILRPQIVKNRAAKVLPTAYLMASSAGDSRRIKSFGVIDDVPQHAEPLHQLRIIEQQNGTQITYLYELNAPSLGILSLHKSKPILSDRHDYIQNLYREIESRWVNTQGDIEDFAAELRAFGGQLFDQLFPDALQHQLWTHREQLNDIMVISTEPFIPWELVHLKPPGQNRLPNETCFLGQMGLVRWVHDVGFPPESLNIKSGDRIRYVIPNYPAESGYQLPQAAQERAFLEQQFGATAVNAQPPSIRQLLENSDFDLLHFAGHGMAEQDNIANAKLLLEGKITNGQYVPTYLSATTVEQYCQCNQQDPGHRPMVVLNACQVGREGDLLTGVGGFAQAFLKGGVGVFVGTLWSVGDRSARTFTETLYFSLLEGMTLSEATTQARQQTKQSGNATWLAYVVYGHPHLKLNITIQSEGTRG